MQDVSLKVTNWPGTFKVMNSDGDGNKMENSQPTLIASFLTSEDVFWLLLNLFGKPRFSHQEELSYEILVKCHFIWKNLIR